MDEKNKNYYSVPIAEENELESYYRHIKMLQQPKYYNSILFDETYYTWEKKNIIALYRELYKEGDTSHIINPVLAMEEAHIVARALSFHMPIYPYLCRFDWEYTDEEEKQFINGKKLVNGRLINLKDRRYKKPYHGPCIVFRPLFHKNRTNDLTTDDSSHFVLLPTLENRTDGNYRERYENHWELHTSYQLLYSVLLPSSDFRKTEEGVELPVHDNYKIIRDISGMITPVLKTLKEHRIWEEAKLRSDADAMLTDYDFYSNMNFGEDVSYDDNLDTDQQGEDFWSQF